MLAQKAADDAATKNSALRCDHFSSAREACIFHRSSLPFIFPWGAFSAGEAALAFYPVMQIGNGVPIPKMSA